jgi:hypothetical protein
MSAEHRVVLKIDPRPDTPLGWLLKAKSVVAVANEHPKTFVSIATLLAQLGDDTQLLDDVQARVRKGGQTEVTARNVQWRVLQKSLRAFVGGVQRLCDDAPSPDHARDIAAQAGLDAKLQAVKVEEDLRGKAIGNGAVKLRGRRPVPRRSAFYEWQISRDGGLSWVTFAITNKARTVVSGLTPDTKVFFRYRKTVDEMPTDWSNTLKIIVG